MQACGPVCVYRLQPVRKQFSVYRERGSGRICHFLPFSLVDLNIKPLWVALWWSPFINYREISSLNF
jgi:hypothetical protein